MIEQETLMSRIENAGTDARAAVRDYFYAIDAGELTMENALGLIADLNGAITFQNLAMEVCRAQRHGYLTQAQSAQWMVWALEMQSKPPGVYCEAHATAREQGRGVTTIRGRMIQFCRWHGDRPLSGMCPKCGSRLPDPLKEARQHLENMLEIAETDRRTGGQ